jgi:hypothetical protein
LVADYRKFGIATSIRMLYNREWIVVIVESKWKAFGGDTFEALDEVMFTK